MTVAELAQQLEALAVRVAVLEADKAAREAEEEAMRPRLAAVLERARAARVEDLALLAEHGLTADEDELAE